MITFSGVHIQKIGGVEGTPTAMDIAVHAGRICRYGGAIWEPLLTHLVFVGLLAYKRSGSVVDLIGGFIHDGNEAVTGEVPRPFKCLCLKNEQLEIDKRIFSRFIPRRRNELDLELIDRCDKVYAVHIEAVELGLPGYAEVVAKCAAEYQTDAAIHNDAEDMLLFRNILQSPFYEDTTRSESEGVKRFADALSWAAVGDYECFLKRVKSWGLL